MISFFKNQNDIADALKDFIDKYWAMELQESKFIEHIKQIAENNDELLFKDGEYTSVVCQKLGIKRLGLLTKILQK